jgi:hypothetical protein
MAVQSATGSYQQSNQNTDDQRNNPVRVTPAASLSAVPASISAMRVPPSVPERTERITDATAFGGLDRESLRFLRTRPFVTDLKAALKQSARSSAAPYAVARRSTIRRRRCDGCRRLSYVPSLGTKYTQSPKLTARTITWSVHSCRADPIQRSTRPFCQGEQALSS